MQNVCEARIGYFYQQLSLGRKIAKIKRMNNNFKTEIDNVNQIFENVVSNYKSNYVNFV